MGPGADRRRGDQSGRDAAPVGGLPVPLPAADRRRPGARRAGIHESPARSRRRPGRRRSSSRAVSSSRRSGKSAIPWSRAMVGVPPGWTDENRGYWDRFVWKRRPWKGPPALAAWVGGSTAEAPRGPTAPTDEPGRRPQLPLRSARPAPPTSRLDRLPRLAGRDLLGLGARPGCAVALLDGRRRATGLGRPPWHSGSPSRSPSSRA